MRILCDSRQTGIFTIAVNISEHRLDYCLFIIHRRVVAQIFQMIQKMQKYNSHGILVYDIFVRISVQHGFHHVFHKVFHLLIFLQAKQKVMRNRILLSEYACHKPGKNILLTKHR